MSRDDSVLYTAQTSSSMASKRATKVQQRQELASQARDSQKSELKPVAAPILAAVDKELNHTITTILSMVGPGTPDKDVKTTLIALNLYKDSLTKLKGNLNVILKDVA